MAFSSSLKQLHNCLSSQAFGLRLIASSNGHAAAPIIQDIGTDTRSLQPGELFLALRGERFDGHQFLPQAIAKGAGALVVEDPQVLNDNPDLPIFVVNNTLAAYQAIAQHWRQEFAIPIIAVTGSVGKTTTKELLAAVLGQQGLVLKTYANFNNEVGVPKTLLQLGSDHTFAVIEMAMRGPGEIACLTQITQPTIGVITNVGTAHIGRLGSEAAIAAAKCELLAEMPSGSIAVLNADNQRLLETAARVWQGKTLTYGLEQGDIKGQYLDAQQLQVEDKIFSLPLPGRHNASNFLAALAVARVLNLDWEPLQTGLTIQLPDGRARQLQLMNDVIILDETYNAGMESMIAALELLKSVPGQRHVAVLGTMKELGDRAEALHYQVGERVQALGLDALLILADEPVAEAIAQGAANVTSYCFDSRAALQEQLSRMIQAGDRILFKASHSVGLDQVLAEFAASRLPTSAERSS